MYHTYILLINLWLCLDNWMSKAVLSCISFMLSVMSPVIELRSLLANVVCWYRSLYKIMYNLEILPLHARISPLGRLRTWAKAFVAWAVMNIWLPDWHHQHLHPAWIFPFSSSTPTSLILGHSQILFRWAWGTSDWEGAKGEGGKRACSPHHNCCCGCCCPTWFVVTHKPQPPHQWVGQKIKFYSLRRGNDEQSIARHCLDGAVVWCPCFLCFSLESSWQWWSDGAGCGLRRSNIGQVLLCGEDWWQWPVPPAQNPSFVTTGCQKTVLLHNIQYYCSNVQPRPNAHADSLIISYYPYH